MQKLLRRIWKNEFLKGGVIFTACSFLINILNYFFNFFVGRSLGPSGYGEIATLFSYITILTIPMTVATMMILQRIGAKNTNQLAYVQSIETFFNSKIKQYFPFFIFLFLLIPLLPSITHLSLLTSVVLIPLIILTVLTAIYHSLMQGLRLFFLVSIITLCMTVFKVLGAVLSLLKVGEIQTIVIFLLLSSLIGYLISLFSLHAHYKTKKKVIAQVIVTKKLRHILFSKQFIFTALSVAAIIILNNVDIIYVKRFFTAQESGLYSSWSLFAKAVLYVLGPLLSISFIFFTQTKDISHQRKSFIYLILILFVLGILSYFFYTFFATYIITYLFGQKFIGIVPFLGLASIYGSLYTLITFMNNYFLATKSKFVLILPFTLPVYVVVLFFLQKHLETIYFLNNIYAFVIVVCYLAAFLLSKE